MSSLFCEHCGGILKGSVEVDNRLVYCTTCGTVFYFPKKDSN